VIEFATDKQVLDYISVRISAQAEREGTPLSDVERKMLYFSENEWTLSDMAEVSAEFDHDYDQNEYERKIAGLIGKVNSDLENDPAEQEKWGDAIAKLSDGDRYLMVMVYMARSASARHIGGGFLPTSGRPINRPPHDFLKLLAAALGVVIVCLALMLLYASFFHG
jgi:hypothetical protein